MKTKELVSILQGCPSDFDVMFRFGDNKNYRKACASLIAEQPMDVDFKDDESAMFEFLEISSINIDMKYKEVQVTFVQGYIADCAIKTEIQKLLNQLHYVKEH